MNHFGLDCTYFLGLLHGYISTFTQVKDLNTSSTMQTTNLLIKKIDSNENNGSLQCYSHPLFLSSCICLSLLFSSSILHSLWTPMWNLKSMKDNPQKGHCWDSSDSMTSNNGKEPVRIHRLSPQTRLSKSRVKKQRNQPECQLQNVC